MSWFLKNIFPLGLASSVTALIAFGLHTMSVNWIEAAHGREMAKQNTVLTEQCEAAKVITEEVSYDYQKKLAARDAALADARRLLNGRCAAPVVVNTASGHHGSSSAGQSSRPDDGTLRADANTLIDIAAEGEKYRLQLIGCQDFIDRSRAARVNQ